MRKRKKEKKKRRQKEKKKNRKRSDTRQGECSIKGRGNDRWVDK